MPVKSVFVVVTGRVHGVGFRYFIRQKAEELNIFGWVKNTPDGKVEIEAEGNPQNLETFLHWIKIGPARANIKSVSIAEISPLRDFTNFYIR
jgi:acylphosphatase